MGAISPGPESSAGLLAGEWLLAAILAAAVFLSVRHLVRVYGHLPLARLGWRRRQAPREYVRSLFDGYAEHYDQHLLVELGYQGANLVSTAVGRHLEAAGAGPARALDLGCGSGLLGVLIAPRVGHLTGVDLSAEMLGEAARRRVYDELYQADMLDFLHRTREGYDLVTAADVLVYTGALEGLMAAVSARLEPGGVLVCTTESQEPPGFRLQPTGRFTHHPAYLAEAGRAVGLTLVSQTKAVLRTQKDAPVLGHLHLLVKGEGRPWRAAGGTLDLDEVR